MLVEGQYGRTDEAEVNEITPLCPNQHGIRSEMMVVMGRKDFGGLY